MGSGSKAGDKSLLDAMIEAHPVISKGVGGLVVGGSLAAISNMIADHIEARRQLKRKKERERGSISPDTVVLFARKPEKNAESPDLQTVQEKDFTKARVEPTVSSKTVKYMNGSQPRETDGRYSSFGKIAETGQRGFSWKGMVDNGVGLALGISAIPVGYAIVDKIHSRMEENRLKRQIAAAQKEYIDLLSDGSKTAEDREFLEMFGLDYESQPSENEKTAADGGNGKKLHWLAALYRALFENETARAFGAGLQDTGSGMLAAGILSTGAAAYITNKLLHNKFDKDEPEDDNPEPVTRILFKNASSEIEITADQALFTLSVLRDCLSDSVPFEKIAAAMDPNDQRWKLYHAFASFAQLNGMTPQQLAEFMNSTGNDQKYLIDGRITLGVPRKSWFTAEQLRKHLIDKKYATQESLAMITPNNIKAMEALVNAQNDPALKGATTIDSVSPEAMQHILDAYGDEKYGIKSPHTYENLAETDPELAGRLMNAAGSTDPAKARAVMEAYMRNNPGSWMNLVGNRQNTRLRNAGVEKYIADLRNGGGLAGFFMNIPYIGDLIQNIMRWYSGTQMGRRFMGNKLMTEFGVPQEARNAWSKGTDFSQQRDIPGWAPAQTQNPPSGQPQVQGSKPQNPPSGQPQNPQPPSLIPTR